MAKNVKAHALLLRHLSTEQRQDFERTSAFSVTAASGRQYRIHVATYTMRDLTGHRNGCLTLTHGVFAIPAEDMALIKKLLIETDERRFRRTAVWSF